MATVTPDDILAALRNVRDGAAGDVVSRGLIQGLVVKDGHVSFAMEVAADEGRAKEPLRLACEKAVLALPGVRSVTAVLTAHRHAGPRTQRAALNAQMRAEGTPQATPRPPGPEGVTAIIAVASGKGGVGKSTVAVNLAIALKALGKRVGLLDADIYGPSVPRMLGLKGKPVSKDGKKLEPMEAWGLKAISIGFLVEEDQPMIWRGPMVMTALTQLLNDVAWAPLDVLVVDMPPGTGDAQLTLAQRVSLAGAVIVSTPQDIGLIDARKAMGMFKTTQVAVFGIVENMSTFVLPHCGKESLFRYGGAARRGQLRCNSSGGSGSLRPRNSRGTPSAGSATEAGYAVVKFPVSAADAAIEKAACARSTKLGQGRMPRDTYFPEV